MPRDALRIGLAISLLCGAPAARADVVKLLNGDEIRGRIVEESAATIILEVAGGTIRIARGEVLEIVREAPGDYAIQKGDELLALGAFDEARALYRLALERGVRDAAGRLARTERGAAERALARGDIQEAERRYGDMLAAARVDPRDGPALEDAARAGIAAARAQRERAIRAAEVGARELAASNFHAARLALDEAAALDRTLAAGLRAPRAAAAAAEGDAFAQQGDHARAAALFELAMAVDPGVGARVARSLATCRVALAIQRFELDDPAGAAAILREAIAYDPTSRAARFYLGIALEAAGDPVQAILVYRDLIGATQVATAVSGDDLGALRQACAKAAAPLPVDPALILDLGRWDAIHKLLPLAARRGKIVVHAADARLAEAVAASAERVAGEIGAWAGEAARERTVAIYVFESEARFLAVTGQPARTQGFTRSRAGGDDMPARIYSHAGAPSLVDVVIPHEMTHALTVGGRAAAGLPLWISEGLALSTEPEALRRGRIASYRRALASGAALPVREIVTLRGYPAPGHLTSYYDGAGALTQFLIERGGRERLLAAGRSAGAGGSIEGVLRDAYRFQTIDEMALVFAGWLAAQR